MSGIKMETYIKVRMRTIIYLLYNELLQTFKLFKVNVTKKQFCTIAKQKARQK